VIGNGFDAFCKCDKGSGNARIGFGLWHPPCIFGNFIGKKERSEKKLPRFVDVTNSSARFGRFAINMRRNRSEMLLAAIAADDAVLPSPDDQLDFGHQRRAPAWVITDSRLASAA
jgi:hypothetical protein